MDNFELVDRVGEFPARGTFRIVMKARRVWWLPAIWPNVCTLGFESDPNETWENAYAQAVECAETGAWDVEIYGFAPENG